MNPVQRKRPILFSAPMVRALLAGTKTQTRRAVKPQPGHRCTAAFIGADGIWRFSYPTAQSPVSSSSDDMRCPYGQPGDRLWARENGWERPERTPKMMREGADTWAPYYYDADELTWQDVEDFKSWGFKRRPSIHMPRWASRIVLEITELRVQRLQEISAADCISEGIGFEVRYGGHCLPDGSHFHCTDPRQSYFSLWEDINGEGSVERNDWVWAVSFKRVEGASP